MNCVRQFSYYSLDDNTLTNTISYLLIRKFHKFSGLVIHFIYLCNWALVITCLRWNILTNIVFSCYLLRGSFYSLYNLIRIKFSIYYLMELRNVKEVYICDHEFLWLYCTHFFKQYIIILFYFFFFKGGNYIQKPFSQ